MKTVKEVVDKWVKEVVDKWDDGVAPYHLEDFAREILGAVSLELDEYDLHDEFQPMLYKLQEIIDNL